MSTAKSVAKTQRTRPEIPAPVTVQQFMWLLYRGIDEGPVAARGGHR